MSTVSANNFAKNQSEYLSKADKKDLLIKADNNEYVIMSAKKYRSLIETAYINSVPGLAQDIIDGMNAPRSEFVELDWKNEL